MKTIFIDIKVVAKCERSLYYHLNFINSVKKNQDEIVQKTKRTCDLKTMRVGKFGICEK